MPKKKYRPEDIINKLREADVMQAEGMIVAEVAKTLGIHEQTYYRWRRENGGMKMSQMKRSFHWVIIGRWMRSSAMLRHWGIFRRSVRAVIVWGERARISWIWPNPG